MQVIFSESIDDGAPDVGPSDPRPERTPLRPDIEGVTELGHELRAEYCASVLKVGGYYSVPGLHADLLGDAPAGFMPLDQFFQVLGFQSKSSKLVKVLGETYGIKPAHIVNLEIWRPDNASDIALEAFALETSNVVDVVAIAPWKSMKDAVMLQLMC